VSFIIFAALYVHVPFMITLVAGEVLAGEATSGPYRLILTRPISRATMVTAKYLAVLTYTISLVFFMAIMSLGLGIPILGTDSLLVIRSETITILSADDLMWRFILAYIYAAMSMVTVASVAFLFSSLVENAIGPIMTTMSIIIGMTIISAIDVPIFDYLRPLFFTNHMNGWKFFFDVPADAESMTYAADWSRIAISGSVLMLHIVGCFVAAQLIIRRKDILT
jgi:ABC-2 type transport system permease protein